MKSTIEQVAEFHRAFECPVLETPQPPPIDRAELRLKLLFEEFTELGDAFAARNITEILDALTDIQYILDGTYLECGLQHVKEPAFEIVHRSNMSKLNSDGHPVRREDGKILKGENYQPPHLHALFDPDYWRNR